MNPGPRIELRRHSAAHPWHYAALDARQREIADEVRQGKPGALLMSEVAPVITVGRRTPESDLTLSPALRAQVQVHATDRGGLATWHGPGQWVLFAVDSLERLTGDPRGVRKSVEALLEVARATAQELGVPAEIRSGAELGVWSQRGKIAAVGVHVERGVLLHGLSVNGLRTPLSFQGLRPCGLDAAVDFLIPGGLPAQESENRLLDLAARLRAQALEKLWSRAAQSSLDGSKTSGL